MPTCRRCTEINFDDGLFYALGSIGFMIKSAGTGCEMCKFFLRIAQRSCGTMEAKQHPKSQVVLQRHEDYPWLVDVNTVGYGRNFELDGWETMRLCASYGFEVPPWEDIARENGNSVCRLISQKPIDNDCIDLAKSWFARCTRHHGRSCALREKIQLPTRLLHVPASRKRLPKLCHTEGQQGQYVTLSYCWGNGNTCKTTLENLEQRKVGIPLNELPKTIRDAVELVRLLGVEWIWIDALCIIQDEPDWKDWTRESSLMAQVYGNSMFTICVNCAGSTDDGIFQNRNIPTSPAFGAHGEFKLQPQGDGWCNSMTEESWLYLRGWALQERILSTRNLHFFKSQIAWECNSALYIEGYRDRQYDNEYHFGKSLLAKFSHQGLYSPITAPSEADIWEHILAWNAFAVLELSIRDFTHESDRLPALSGLATAFEHPELGEYFAGVWSRNPFLSMAWWGARENSAKEARIPSWSGVGARDFIMQVVSRSGKENDFTSWESWNIKYGPRLIDKKMVYPPRNPDPKGIVLEGSHVVVTGFCRTVYILARPGIEYEIFELEEKRDSPYSFKPGVRVCMDMRPGNWASIASFLPDLSDVNIEVDKLSSEDESKSKQDSSDNENDNSSTDETLSGDGKKPKSINKLEETLEHANGETTTSEETEIFTHKESKSDIKKPLGVPYLCIQIQRRLDSRIFPKIFSLVLARFPNQDEDSYQRVGIIGFDEVQDEEKWVERTLKLF